MKNLVKIIDAQIHPHSYHIKFSNTFKIDQDKRFYKISCSEYIKNLNLYNPSKVTIYLRLNGKNLQKTTANFPTLHRSGDFQHSQKANTQRKKAKGP